MQDWPPEKAEGIVLTSQNVYKVKTKAELA